MKELLLRQFNQASANVQGTDARAQVVYTLTQFPAVKEVRIGVEGSDPEPAAGRADFQSIALPSIFVDRPAWNAAAGNPMRVTGLANVFEATFRVQVLDGKGKVLADQQVMATCGTGCWGSFKADVPYNVAKPQYGTLRVFDLSAKDGKPENLAASASRLFLGVRIECAQCHNHPFAKWKREEFWGLAAFFAGVDKQGKDEGNGPIRESANRHELAIPGVNKIVQASFLSDEAKPQWGRRGSSGRPEAIRTLDGLELS